MLKQILNGRVLTPQGWLEGGSVIIDGNKILAVLCDDDQKRVETIFINDNCIGCSLCKRACPADAISGVIKQKFNIDEKLCIKCGFCLTKCKKEAITATYRNVHGGEL